MESYKIRLLCAKCVSATTSEQINRYGLNVILEIKHFIVQLMHTTSKNVGLLKHFKIKEAAPTCFGLHGNYHHGATAST
jgi:hypothetical protein